MTEIRKPDDEILRFITENYRYDDGKINSQYKNDIGEYRIVTGRLYCMIKIKRKNIRRYHIVWFLCKGEWPTQQIDHIDRNSSNDKIDNLRYSDSFGQKQNTDVYKGYRGFSIWKKGDGKYREKNLVVRNQAKKIILGYAKDREEAMAIIDKYWEGVKPGENEKSEVG